MSATDRAWKASVPTQLLPGQKGSRKPGVHRRISRQSCGKVTFMEQKGRPHTGKKTGIQLSCSSPHRYIPEDREIMKEMKNDRAKQKSEQRTNSLALGFTLQVTLTANGYYS